jgi:hypothetical protein
MASVVESRLACLPAKVGLKYQNGFLRGRGCTDSDCTLMLDILRRYGVPERAPLQPHGSSIRQLVSQLLHSLTLHGRDCLCGLRRARRRPSSTVGIKQGDTLAHSTLAPILSLFVIQAGMETLES